MQDLAMQIGPRASACCAQSGSILTRRPGAALQSR